MKWHLSIFKWTEDSLLNESHFSYDSHSTYAKSKADYIYI